VSITGVCVVSTLPSHPVTKETQWADPRIAHQAQQNQQAPVSGPIL